MEILKGNGPCNKKRLQTNVIPQQENLWVKEAAIAFAEKQEKISM
jgi:ring-1,2-phenylacetyl-CoA epoxidase subunit PaaA